MKTEIKALIIDMDGVLWKDSQAIGNLPEIFSEFNKKGLQVTLATNNATRTIPEYEEKLAQFGVTLSAQQIVNSSQATLHLLTEKFPGGGNIYLVGEESLANTLATGGFVHGDHGVIAVVSSLDRNYTYEKMRNASRWVRRGAFFVATNSDMTFPTPQGLVPGAGAILVSIEAASEKQAVIAGKPSPEMYKVAMERMSVPPSETLVIGDRLETDIAGGQVLGCKTALVLSGVTTMDRAAAWNPRPDWISIDLTTLLREL